MSWRELGAANQRHIWELVRLGGIDGISRAAVQRQVAMDHFTVSRHLTDLRRLGAVAMVGSGKGARWVAVCEPKEYEKRKRYQHRETAASWAHRWSEDRPLQRIVPAAEAPPLKHVGVRSVWELA